jgi:inhibitor of KinA
LKSFKLTYKPYGNNAILIEWPQKIAIEILNDIRFFTAKIHQNNNKEILEVNYVYSSLLVIYDFNKICFLDLKNKLKKVYIQQGVHPKKIQTTTWEIPVCYHHKLGIDLAYLASKKELTIEDVISLHTKTSYTVYGIGFLPGFLYLGGLSEVLFFPRKETPRLAVPKGAVAIGGNQTGIYPQQSPGGWQIIGQTPINLFNAAKDVPCEIIPGDTIVFKSISIEEFNRIILQEEQGTYMINKKLIND